MLHRTDNFWSFETGMITEKSLLEEQGLFLHGWYESRSKTETKNLYPGVPYLLPSNMQAAGNKVLPQFVFCRYHTKLVFYLMSFSLGYPERGERESTKVQNVETFRLNNLTYLQAKLLPPQLAAYTSWNKLVSEL